MFCLLAVFVCVLQGQSGAGEGEARPAGKVALGKREERAADGEATSRPAKRYEQAKFAFFWLVCRF